MANGGWLKLIDQLKYPTYTAYDFANKYLYVCDCDEILQFEIDFGATIEAVKNGAVAQNVSCGGLAVDKFSNLFYVDTKKRSQGSSFSSIMRINRDLLQLDKYPADIVRVVYDGAASKSAQSIKDIAIEHEFLYWTNDSHSDGHGGVHKAFTEPFIKAEPFQTYEIKDIARAEDVTTNENFLFFTGEQSRGRGLGTREPELFIQKKQGAGLYYHFNGDLTDRLKRPGSLATYKDTVLLIANEGFISMLDITKFPPLSQDFKDDTITAEPPIGALTSNSACASNLPPTKAARGLTLISEDRMSVQAKTLSYSGSAAASVGAGLMVLLGLSLF